MPHKRLGFLHHLGSKSENAIAILDNVDPNKTFSSEMTKQLQDVRALETLMNSSELKDSDNEITLKEAAEGVAARSHAYLQKNYARIAMLDGDG